MDLVMVICVVVVVVMMFCVVAAGRPHPWLVTASDPPLGCRLGMSRPPSRAPEVLPVMCSRAPVVEESPIPTPLCSMEVTVDPNRFPL